MRRLIVVLSALAIVALLYGVSSARPHKMRNARAAKNTPAAAVKGPAVNCTARDPHVAVPNAPHGMYVWNPYKVQGGKFEKALEASVIGKDPTLCGVSLVVSWSAAEPSKGKYDWSSIATQAAPYLRAHLRYNLLFADASEVGGSDSATPAWVFNQDRVARVQCPKQVPYPNFLDPKFENDWASFIAAAVKKFGSDPNVGYMRFGIGAGVEAYPGHMEAKSPRPCYNAWVKTAQWTYAKWVKHSLNVVDALARQQSRKQLMVAMNYMRTRPTCTPMPTPSPRRPPSAASRSVRRIWASGMSRLPAQNPRPAIRKPRWSTSIGAKHLSVTPAKFRSSFNRSPPQRPATRKATSSIFPSCCNTRLPIKRKFSNSIRKNGLRATPPTNLRCAPPPAYLE